MPSSQALCYSLLQTLGVCFQRDRSVQKFFAELTDLWRQCDEMAPSLCPTCPRCLATAQDRDFLHMYEFLMRLHPEFETVRAQLLHRVTPPSLSDTLALVIAAETRLRSLEAAPSSAAPHTVLAASQLPQSVPLSSLPLLPPPLGFSAPVRPASQHPSLANSSTSPGSGAPLR